MRIQSKKETTTLSFREQAYSLVEVLVAVVVLGIMFVSLYSGFSAGFAVTQLARENLRATQILQEKMETIRLYTWDQINTPGFMPTNFVENFYALGTNANANTMNYTGTVRVASAPVTYSYSNELKVVKIQLQWVSADVLRSRQMQTYVTRHGLQNYIY
jgi:prepilin-type N-terminal cleavage/methylation domain-containing protein